MSRLAAALGVAIWCTATVGVALAQSFPFTGIVDGDNVYVRSGAGSTYYVVSRLNQNDLVEVHEEVFGWYQISPPAGSYSFVSKNYVKVDASGTKGEITGTRVSVRAPSTEGPGQSYRIQVRLNTGDAVQIVGEDGAYYRVVPPKDAFLFVKKELVQQATAEQIAAIRGKPAADPQNPVPVPPTDPKNPVPDPAPNPNLKPPVENPIPPVNPKPVPVPTAREVVVDIQIDGAIQLEGKSYAPGAQLDALRELAASEPAIGSVSLRTRKDVPYKHVVAVFDAATTAGLPNLQIVTQEPLVPQTDQGKPVEPKDPKLVELEKRYADLMDQDPIDAAQLTGLLDDFKTFLAENAQLANDQKSLAKARIELLETRRQLSGLLKEIDAYRQQLLASHKQRQQQLDALPKKYTASGRLLTSSIYNGQQLPLLYRVVDPTTDLTVAYVQPGSRIAELRDLLGKSVGVIGLKQYDPVLKLTFLVPTEVDDLALKAGLAP